MRKEIILLGILGALMMFLGTMIDLQRDPEDNYSCFKNQDNVTCIYKGK